ncbi:aaa family atpase [Colletotrichum scovillei]|nr:aaa family atpase [Colletotrichum scovillei]
MSTVGGDHDGPDDTMEGIRETGHIERESSGSSVQTHQQSTVVNVTGINDNGPEQVDAELLRPRVKERIESSLGSLKAMENRLRNLSRKVESIESGDEMASIEMTIQQQQEDYSRLQVSLETLRPNLQDENADGRRLQSPATRGRSRRRSGHPGSGSIRSSSSQSSRGSVSTTDSYYRSGICTPKLNYGPWLEIASDSRGHEYFAIDIPSNEPTRAELQATKDFQRQQHDLHRQAIPIVPDQTQLPERIRVNSNRLMRFILSAAEEGISRPINSTQSLHILRPFKVLLTLGGRLQNLINMLESARKIQQDASEEEYLAQLNDASLETVLDELVAADPSHDPPTDIRELTAYILDLRCLQEFMQKTLQPQVERITNMTEPIRFSELWYIFPEGSLIISRDHRVLQKVWKVMGRGGGRWSRSRPGFEIPVTNDFNHFFIECFCLDFDGDRFVPVWQFFTIPEFEGVQDIMNLLVVPIKAAERDQSLFDRGAVQARGKKFMELASNGARHRHFSGRSLHLTLKGQKLAAMGREAPKSAFEHAERIDSEVIVDMAKALEEVPTWLAVPEHRMKSPSTAGELAPVFNKRQGSALRDTDTGSQTFIFSERRKWRQWETVTYTPSGDDQLLLPNRVFAFILRNRKWACLPIVHDIRGNDLLLPISNPPEPWDDLELPTGHKELVQSLISSHFSQDTTRRMHLDLAEGSSYCYMACLVWERLQQPAYNRPLLPITCGDLGLEPYEVESKLQEIFRLAHAWDCVLLLDEADIFLAQRTTTDMQRNALVSEYYEGILFLTTNRVGTFDEAFKSRIHMSLYYPPLSEHQTARIWISHIRKVKANGVQIDEQEVRKFARQIWVIQGLPERGPVWNGRQIRNAFQSAIALAGYHTQTGQQIHLTVENFRRVGEVSDQFSRYIYKTKLSQTDADLNRNHGIRRDEFGRDPGTRPAAPWVDSQVVDPFLPANSALQPQRPNVQFGGSTQAAGFQAVTQDPFHQSVYSTSPWQHETTTQPHQQQHQQQSHQGFLQQQPSSTQIQVPSQQMFPPQQGTQPQIHQQSQPTYPQNGLVAGSVPNNYEQQTPRSLPQQAEYGTTHQPASHTQMPGNPNFQGPTGSSPWEMS